MTHDSLGVITQVLAVLVLAAAFIPTLRGQLRTSKRFWAKSRVFIVSSALVAVLIDSLVLITGIDISNIWVNGVLVVINAFAVTALVISTIEDTRSHANGDSNTSAEERKE